MLITVVTAATFAFAAAAPTVVTTTTLGECAMSFAFYAMTSDTCLRCLASLVWRSVRGSKANGTGVRLVASEANCSLAAAGDSSRLSM